MNQKALRAGCASRGEEVSCKEHCSSAKESQATLCFCLKKQKEENERIYGDQWKACNVAGRDNDT